MNNKNTIRYETNYQLPTTKQYISRVLQSTQSNILILLLVISSTFFIGCQSEFTSSEEIKRYENESLSAFYLRLKSDGLENRTTRYTISEATDLMNDGLNFLYCRPDEFYDESKVSIDTFAVAVDGSNLILDSDLESLMEDIAEFAGSFYHADLRSDKQPFLFEVNPLAGSTPGYKYYQAVFSYHAASGNSAMDEYVYTDSWIYGQFGADVSSQCSDEEYNADAADLLRRDLRKNNVYRNKSQAYYFKNPYVICYEILGQYCFLVEIPFYFPIDETIDELENVNDVTPNDNYCDYLLFYNTSSNPNFHDCLTSDEMNYHYEKMDSLIDVRTPSPITGQFLSQIEVGYDLLLGSSSTYFHGMIQVNAERQVITDSQFEEPEILPNP